MEKILDDFMEKILEKASIGVKVMWAITKGISNKTEHLLTCNGGTERFEKYNEYKLSLLDTDTFNKVKISVRYWKEKEEDMYSIFISDIKESTVGVLDDIDAAIDNALYVLEHSIIKPMEQEEKKELDNQELIKALETILKSLKEGK